MKLKNLKLTSLLAALALPFVASADYTVSPDGKGDYKTVNEAVQAVPKGLEKPFTVFVKNGDYKEKVFVESRFVRLVGESRDGVVIHYPILNEEWDREWHAAHPDGKGDSRWGNAVINIKKGADDFTMENLTVYNNYGSTVKETHNHQFAVFGRATRTIIRNCNVWSDGSDTVSLWCAGGMYYHDNCHFRSWGVDFVCPRGWCYAKNCKIEGRGPAAVWHDGGRDKDMKFVLDRCSFDSPVKGSELGRHHGDACFYLKDCKLGGGNMSKKIAHARTDAMKWGERVFYSNCKYDDGTQPEWAKDNFDVDPKIVDAAWTFGGKWNPEAGCAAAVTIRMMGDSTMVSYPESAAPQQGWGQRFQEHLREGVTVVDYAKGGSSTKSTLSGSKEWTRMQADLKAGDYVVIAFGHNDSFQLDPNDTQEKHINKAKYVSCDVPEYKDNMRFLVKFARERGATPVFATSIPRYLRAKVVDGHVEVRPGRLMEYVNATKELGAELNVPVLDIMAEADAAFRKMSPEEVQSLYMIAAKNDKTHTTDKGANFFATIAARLASEQKLPFAPAAP